MTNGTPQRCDRPGAATFSGGEPKAINPAAPVVRPVALSPWEWSALLARLLATGPWSLDGGHDLPVSSDATRGGEPWRAI
jgi:hypothetical protein